MKKITLSAAFALALASSGVSANTLTFQNVTFSTANLGAGELQLTISNALNANGDWTGIHYLEAFSLGIGGTWTTASLTGWTVRLPATRRTLAATATKTCLYAALGMKRMHRIEPLAEAAPRYGHLDDVRKFPLKEIGASATFVVSHRFTGSSSPGTQMRRYPSGN